MPSSGYTAITFVAGEQPTTAKWNLIGSNFESFRLGNALEDNAVLARHLAANIINSSKIDWAESTGKIWYEELGRTVLGSANSAVTVNGIAAKKFLRLIFIQVAPSASTSIGYRFNNDSANNYATRRSMDGTAEVTVVSHNRAEPIANTSASLGLHVTELVNLAGTEKMAVGIADRANAGAGAAPSRDEYAFKWASSSQVTRVDAITSSGTYGVGSTLIVLGHD